MMIPAPAEQPASITPVDDEIDLREVAGALGRRWQWIASGGAGESRACDGTGEWGRRVRDWKF